MASEFGKQGTFCRVFRQKQRRFEQESRILTRIDNQHVIKVVDYITEPLLCLVREFFPGTPIDKMLGGKQRYFNTRSAEQMLQKDIDEREKGCKGYEPMSKTYDAMSEVKTKLGKTEAARDYLDRSRKAAAEEKQAAASEKQAPGAHQ